ncbi:TFIIH regulator [Schizosaccharomyces cryophilus OY26]|uniref:MMS19 nucleotide excision repair protein n=1 Tax=Schizosaccharomyces cryophilus (strain OY26 / ATCC MYA-4695 / CBS 11777 / NBRC 106824 / NRRL Y48691) TaxID=653667 RepID=S9VZC1_SCHCR|nr:TFIIH regulator [Schizosaccharomyces cryophilus OY26]EPY51539.1 TFIIH regulator [Schizosaccharomyces cryophilus OY26]
MNSSLVASYLFTVDKNESEAKDIVNHIIKDIIDEKIGIVDVVTSIGDYLTNTNVSMRGKALLLLSQVLEGLPKDRLPVKHVSVLLQFYLNRLDDEVTLMENSLGIVALLHMDNFPSPKAVDVCYCYFDATDMPKYSQKTRYSILKIFDTIIDEYLFDISPNTKDAFFAGICTTFAGEKDPRNLFLVFSMLQKILKRFPIGGFEKQFFDITYCYFPITFRAPPDAQGLTITTDDLKEQLKNTLVATDAFSKLLLPELFKKLKASAVRVKIDALNIFVQVCQNWHPTSYLWSCTEYWESIKQEILESTDTTLQNTALSALNLLTKNLYKENGLSSNFTNFVGVLLTQSFEYFSKDYTVKVASSIGAVFAAIASVSLESFNYCCEKYLPYILELPIESESLEKRHGMLVFLNYVFKCDALLYGKWRSQNSVDCPNSLLPHKNKWLSFMSGSLMGVAKDEVSLRTSAVDVLYTLSTVKGYLDMNELTMIVQFLVELAFDLDDPLRKSATDKLKDIGLYKPDIILLVVFPHAFSLFPEISSKISSAEDATFKQSLHILITLSEEKSLFKTLVIRLVEALKDQLNVAKHDSQYASIVLQTLCLAFRNRNIEKREDVPSYLDHLVPWLYTTSFKYAPISVFSIKDLTSVSQIINEIVRVCPLKNQISFSEELYKLYFTSEESSLIQDDVQVRQLSATFCLAKPMSDQKYAGLVLLLQGGMNGLQRSVPVVKDLHETLLNSCIEMVEQATIPAVMLSALRLLSSLLNKCSKDEDINTYLQTPAITSLYGKAQSKDKGQSHAALQILSWLAKALVSRKLQSASNIVNYLLECLHLEDAASVVNAFAVIIKDDPILNKTNYYVERILYKQKFYAELMPKLLEAIPKVTSKEKPFYLMVLSIVIGNVPKDIVIPDMPTVLPLLLQCLVLADSGVQYSALNVIMTAIKEIPSLISDYMNSLIPPLLAIPKDLNNPAAVRLLALKCLGLLPELVSPIHIQPFKAKVIRELVPCLDDIKRVVRTEASRTRHKWYT